MESLLFDLSVIIVIASMLGILFKFLKQPLIPAYILAGILSGPVMHLIHNESFITTLSEIGIAFLLFIVGLEINLSKLKVVSKIATIGCFVKSLIMFLLFYLIALMMNFSNMNAVFIGLIFSFSSTMIVIKILTDKNEVQTLHGRILIGMLLFEDLLAVIVLSLLGDANSFSFFMIALLKAIIVIIGSIAIGRYLIKPLFNFVAKDQKLLFIVAISFCFVYSFLFDKIGLSMSVGAFFAGIILANTPYNIEIVSHIKPLRDFFAIMFFAGLGYQLSLAHLSGIVMPFIILLIAFYLIKPLLVLTITRFFGYTFSTSFLTGLNMSQISEFSLIIVSLGNSLGLISKDIVSLSILLALSTMTISTYLSRYDYWIMNHIKNIIRPIDIFRHKEKHLAFMDKDKAYDTILIGYNRLGYHLLKKLERMKKSVLIVDLDPEVINRLIQKKKLCLYGDVGDYEIIERLKIHNVNLILSTVPELYDNRLLIKEVKKRNKKAIIFATALTPEDALKLYDEGADYVMVPHLLGGEHMAMMLEEFTRDIKKLVDAKLGHIEELRHRSKEF